MNAYWQTAEGLTRLADAGEILAKIRMHHGNAVATDPEILTFAEELNPTVSLQEGLEAVRVWYAEHESGQWMSSGDVNKQVYKIRSANIPSEEEIGELAETYGVTSEQYFVWRRRLIHGITRRHETRPQALAAATHATLEIARTEKHARVITSSRSLPDIARAFKEIPNAK